jgi:hypothetical protein
MSLPSRNVEADLPLLEGGVHNASRDREDEVHGKHTKWVAIPFRKLAYLLLAVLLTIACIASAVGSVFGLRAYHRLFFPHRAVFASKSTSKDPSRIVRPYFGPARSGGKTANPSLSVTVWFREGKKVEIPPFDPTKDDYWEWSNKLYEKENRMRAPGEQGYLFPEEGENEWESLWSKNTGDIVTAGSRGIYANIKLPGRVV